MIQCEKNNEYFLWYYNEHIEEIKVVGLFHSNRILFTYLSGIYTDNYDLKRLNCDVITKIKLAR